MILLISLGSGAFKASLPQLWIKEISKSDFGIFFSLYFERDWNKKCKVLELIAII